MWKALCLLHCLSVLQCFDDVKAVLFVAALSGYDMCLYEDDTQVTWLSVSDTHRQRHNTMLLYKLLFLSQLSSKFSWKAWRSHLNVWQRPFTGIKAPDTRTLVVISLAPLKRGNVNTSRFGNIFWSGFTGILFQLWRGSVKGGCRAWWARV